MRTVLAKFLICFALLFITTATASGHVVVTNSAEAVSRTLPATAEISSVGRGIRGNQTVTRIAEEAQGALSQANRILDSGSYETRWGQIYQNVRGTGGNFEFLARRNALHQESERLLLNNRYVTEAIDNGYMVEFNRGSLLNVRSSSGSISRPDIQIRTPGGSFGIIDFTTPGSAPKIFKYGTPQQAPYMINVTVP